MTDSTDKTATDEVREHVDDLRTLAESDLPAARWAERLLELVDEPGGDRR